MAPWCRAMAVLAGNTGLVPTIPVTADNYLELQFQKFCHYFCYMWHRCFFCSPGKIGNLAAIQNYKFFKWRTYPFDVDKVLLFFFFSLLKPFFFFLVLLSLLTFCTVLSNIFPCTWGDDRTRLPLTFSHMPFFHRLFA